MTHSALHTRCAIVLPSAMMRVQNYAGSGIKRDSCWKFCSGWHDFVLFVQQWASILTDTVHHAGLSAIEESLVVTK